MRVKSKEVQLATRLTAEQAKRVVEFADTFGMSVSAVIRLAILKMLDEEVDSAVKSGR
ncbi:MAG: hypothetical protein RJA56_1448 [Pseudomonadota bacterium]